MLLLLLSRFSHVRLCVTPQMRPTRLPHPWNSPGKNTGVGCHFLLQCIKVKVKLLSYVRLFTTPRTTAYQAPPSMGFSRQEYWSGVPLPSPSQTIVLYKWSSQQKASLPDTFTFPLWFPDSAPWICGLIWAPGLCEEPHLVTANVLGGEGSWEVSLTSSLQGHSGRTRSRRN